MEDNFHPMTMLTLFPKTSPRAMLVLEKEVRLIPGIVLEYSLAVV
jgi:hypothetical protein